MDTKALRGIEIKDATKGEVSAVFSQYNVKDHDGDVTLQGAFADHGPVVISDWNHGTSIGAALPVGTGTIREEKGRAVLDGHFLMDTPHGAAAFATVKALHAKGLGEWSYNYDPSEYHFGEWTDGSRVRYLDKLKAHEVSPVLRGAGIGTTTLSAKGLELATESDWRSAIRPHPSGLSLKSWDGDDLVDGLDTDAGVAVLRSIFAWVDSTADPDLKGSYRLPHHDGPGGAASLRGCVAALALLNSGRDIGIPEGDRKGVHAHLAGHLLDHEIEAPDLAPAGGGSLKLADRAGLVLADLGGLRKVTTETLARRAVRGKGLSPQSREILGWLREELGELTALLETPDETTAREYAAFIQRQHRGDV